MPLIPFDVVTCPFCEGNGCETCQDQGIVNKYDLSFFFRKK